ncbi:MAG: signal peptidase II [Oscillospiraceae bacterium]|nr:signal peptidase II [Oscillospiraceae bacterium]
MREKRGFISIAANLVVLLVFIADQVIKHLILKYVGSLGHLRICGGFVDFSVVKNTGMGFGILGNHQLVVVVLVSILAPAGLLAMNFVRSLTPGERISAALIVGGAFGNLADRICRGAVVDYVGINFFRFSPFNFADVCICLGCFLLLFSVLAGGRKV